MTGAGANGVGHFATHHGPLLVGPALPPRSGGHGPLSGKLLSNGPRIWHAPCRRDTTRRHQGRKFLCSGDLAPEAGRTQLGHTLTWDENEPTLRAKPTRTLGAKTVTNPRGANNQKPRRRTPWIHPARPARGRAPTHNRPHRYPDAQTRTRHARWLPNRPRRNALTNTGNAREGLCKRQGTAAKRAAAIRNLPSLFPNRRPRHGTMTPRARTTLYDRAEMKLGRRNPCQTGKPPPQNLQTAGRTAPTVGTRAGPTEPGPTTGPKYGLKRNPAPTTRCTIHRTARPPFFDHGNQNHALRTRTKKGPHTPPKARDQVIQWRTARSPSLATAPRPRGGHEALTNPTGPAHARGRLHLARANTFANATYRPAKRGLNGQGNVAQPTLIKLRPAAQPLRPLCISAEHSICGPQHALPINSETPILNEIGNTQTVPGLSGKTKTTWRKRMKAPCHADAPPLYRTPVKI